MHVARGGTSATKGTLRVPLAIFGPRSAPVRKASCLLRQSRTTHAWVCRAEVPYNGFRRTATFADWRDTMAEGPFTAKRANPRFSFFADAEITLRDGTWVRAQLSELSSRGCYIDMLEPIPTRTKLRLRICDGMSTCELDGKVIYMHSGGGFGIFGVGVVFEEMDPEQRSAVEAWLRELRSAKAGLNRTESTSRVVIRRAHNPKVVNRFHSDPQPIRRRQARSWIRSSPNFILSY